MFRNANPFFVELQKKKKMLFLKTMSNSISKVGKRMYHSSNLINLATLDKVNFVSVSLTSRCCRRDPQGPYQYCGVSECKFSRLRRLQIMINAFFA